MPRSGARGFRGASVKRTPPAVGFGALALFAALVIVVAEGSLDAHAQAAPSISIELSPGDHLPNTVPLTAEVTLSNLDPASYSELTFRADLTGHESRTSTATARTPARTSRYPWTRARRC